MTSNKVPFDLPTNDCRWKYCPCQNWFHLKVQSGIRRKISHRCARNFRRHYLKASATSLIIVRLQTCCLPSLFVKKVTRKTVVLARWLFAVCQFRSLNLASFSELQSNNNTTELQNVFVIVVYHFVYSFVAHVVLVLSFRLAKVADSIYLDL